MAIKIIQIGGTTFVGDLVNNGMVLRKPRVLQARIVESKIAGAPPITVINLGTLFDYPDAMIVGSFNFCYQASATVSKEYLAEVNKPAVSPLN